MAPTAGYLRAGRGDSARDDRAATAVRSSRGGVTFSPARSVTCLRLRVRLEERDDLLAPRECVGELARHRVLRGLRVHRAAGKAVALRGRERSWIHRLVGMFVGLEHSAFRVRPAAMRVLRISVDVRLLGEAPRCDGTERTSARSARPHRRASRSALSASRAATVRSTVPTSASESVRPDATPR